tara:strand:- start:450 stop:710 length:261 start_codon:yes stop_codon:yes gene_type:complete
MKANNDISDVNITATDLRTSFRDDLLQHSKNYFLSQVSRHIMNAEILLQRQVGVADHPDVMQVLEDEFKQIAHYKELVDVIEEYFE